MGTLSYTNPMCNMVEEDLNAIVNREEAGSGSGSGSTHKRQVGDASSSSSSTPQTSDGEVSLKRSVGLWSGVAFIAGSMIGSGIFVSPTGVVARVGSVGLSLFVWLICGIFSMLGALCFAELGCLFPKSGADYTYLLEIYGGGPRNIGAIVAFLYCWVNVTLFGPSGLAVVSLVFAEYLTAPFYDACGPPTVVNKLLAISLIIFLTGINCVSVKAAIKVQNVFTIAKILALVIIIIMGMVELGKGSTKYLGSESFVGSRVGASELALAFYSGLWAYGGWSHLNFITEEVKNPNRNLPLAIFIAVPLVTCLYLLVNVSYFTVLSPEALVASEAAAVTFAEKAFPQIAWSIPLFVAASCIGAANGSTLAGARSFFVASREGHIPEVLSMISIKHFTPSPALVFQINSFYLCLSDPREFMSARPSVNPALSWGF